MNLMDYLAGREMWWARGKSTTCSNVYGFVPGSAGPRVLEWSRRQREGTDFSVRVKTRVAAPSPRPSPTPAAALRSSTSPTAPRPAGPSTPRSTPTTPAGQEATITDAAGNTWSFTYDLLGRRVGAGDPDTGWSASSTVACVIVSSTGKASPGRRRRSPRRNAHLLDGRRLGHRDEVARRGNAARLPERAARPPSTSRSPARCGHRAAHGPVSSYTRLVAAGARRRGRIRSGPPTPTAARPRPTARPSTSNHHSGAAG